MSCEKIGFCLQGQGHSESFATKLNLSVDHAKKCPVKMLDCCVQGQCHSQG